MGEEEAQGTARRRRRDPEATRSALLDALLGLLEEGDRAPTRKAVAERAGVSERTVFVHFADREALYASAALHQRERWLALAERVSPDRPTEHKVEALLRQRRRMYELMTPIRVVGLELEPHSPALARLMREGDDWFRADLAEMFAPELERDAASPGGLLDALDAAVSWAAWNHLRQRRGLSAEAAVAALGRTARALLRSCEPDES